MQSNAPTGQDAALYVLMKPSVPPFWYINNEEEEGIDRFHQECDSEYELWFQQSSTNESWSVVKPKAKQCPTGVCNVIMKKMLQSLGLNLKLLCPIYWAENLCKNGML